MTAVLSNFKDDFISNKPDERLCSSKRLKKSLNLLTAAMFFNPFLASRRLPPANLSSTFCLYVCFACLIAAFISLFTCFSSVQSYHDRALFFLATPRCWVAVVLLWHLYMSYSVEEAHVLFQKTHGEVICLFRQECAKPSRSVVNVFN